MNNESILNSVGTIFSGRGGSIRTAIVSIVILAIFGEIIDSKYQFTVRTTNGETLSLKPSENTEDEESPSTESQGKSSSIAPEEAIPIE